MGAEAKNANGGKRKGAGRPPFPESERGGAVHVYLSAGELATAKKHGAGSPQVGIKAGLAALVALAARPKKGKRS